MVKRTKNVSLIVKATEQYSENIEGFDPEGWLSNPKNVALINANGDVALFEDQVALPGTVCGHYFFFARGRQAVKAAEEFLHEVFTGDYGIETITGLTPLDHKGALWMNRRLGFIRHGEVDTVVGPCAFVILTKKDWEAQQL